MYRANQVNGVLVVIIISLIRADSSELVECVTVALMVKNLCISNNSIIYYQNLKSSISQN